MTRKWEALDSNTIVGEQALLHVTIGDAEEHEVAIDGDWSLHNLREYMEMRYNLNNDFSLVINDILVYKRLEASTFCKSIEFPYCIYVKHK